jgi:NTE family protein
LMLGLVLSGGGLYGALHVGVLEGLAELGIEPDLVVGTSAGALVGSLWAAGLRPDDLRALAHSLRPRDLPWQWRQIAESLVRRHRLPGHLASLDPLLDKVAARLGGIGIRQLPKPCWVVAAALRRRCAVVFGPALPVPAAGPLGALFPWPHDLPVVTAVQASMAVPGLFAPVQLDDDWLVDGGIVDDYPVDVAALAGATHVIGVLIVDRGGPARGAEAPNLLTTAARGLTLLLEEAADTRRALVEHLLSVRLVELRLSADQIGLADFRQMERLVQRGLEVTRRQADRLRALVVA